MRGGALHRITIRRCRCGATGYGEAVARGLATAPGSTWVWLLHDDVRVEPTTLQALLDYAQTSPSAALLGPKVIDWHDGFSVRVWGGCPGWRSCSRPCS